MAPSCVGEGVAAAVIAAARTRDTMVDSLDRRKDLSRALLCELANAVDDEALIMLGRPMEVESRAIAIDLPERKDLGPLVATADVETDGAGLCARGIAKFSKHRCDL